MKSLQNTTTKRISSKGDKILPKKVKPADAVVLTILRNLMTDVTRLRPGTKGLERDYVTLEARIEHEGLAFLGTALCSLGKALDEGLSSGTFTCPTGFKTSKGSKIPLLFGGIFCDVFDSKTGVIKERDLTEDVKILRQLLFFLQETCTIFSSINFARGEDRSEFRPDRFCREEHCSLSEGSYQPSGFLDLIGTR